MSEQEAVKALIKSRKEMGKLLKNKTNPFHKNTYADLEAVLDAVIPVFNANNFAVYQPSGCDEHGDYLKTVFVHDSGHSFESKVYLRFPKQDMQGYGGAMTYARRYGLQGMAGIAAEDDDGNSVSNLGTNKKTSVSNDEF